MAQKKRLSVVQIIGCLWEAEAEVSIKDLCRRHGLSDADDYLWRSKFGGMTVSDAQRLRTLEGENGKLKKLLAEAMLDNAVLKDLASKNF